MLGRCGIQDTEPRLEEGLVDLPKLIEARYQCSLRLRARNKDGEGVGGGGRARERVLFVQGVGTHRRVG